jgi:DNA repair photolyase
MVICQYCNKEYKTYQSRSNHIKKFHENNNNSNKNYTAKITPKSELTSAKITPKNGCKNVCEYCYTEFTRRDSLKKHYDRCRLKNSTLHLLNEQLKEMKEKYEEDILKRAEETNEIKSMLLEIMNKKAKVHPKTLH